MNKLNVAFKWLSRSILILIALALIGGAFYYYEYRPSEIKRKCTANARHESGQIARLYDTDGPEKLNKDDLRMLLQSQSHIYQYCLHENGL